MSSDPKIIENIYKTLVGKVKNLDQRLMIEYEPSISKIEQLRYEFFKKCINDKHDSASCYYQSQRYQLYIDFQKEAKIFQECINKAANKTAWEKEGEICLNLYEKSLKKNLELEINRVLKSL